VAKRSADTAFGGTARIRNADAKAVLHTALQKLRHIQAEKNRRILATHGNNAKTRPPSLRKEIFWSTEQAGVQRLGPFSWLDWPAFYRRNRALSSGFFQNYRRPENDLFARFYRSP
jgi:hypothetical protein